MNGTPGSDLMFAEGGNDTVNGLGGSDWSYAPIEVRGLSGDEGEDTVNGGDGSDWLFGGTGEDTVNGGAGSDWLHDSAGRDMLNGGGGGDKIDAMRDDREGSSAAVDTVSGGFGNDVIGAKDGFKDIISCGPGKADYAFADKGLDRVQPNCERRTLPRGCSDLLGQDWDLPPLPSREITGNEGNNQLVGTNNIACIDIISGGGGNDTLKGLDGWDFLPGGLGRDTLYGGNGPDGLDGGENSDVIYGGPGNDWIYAIEDGEQDTISCGPGADFVHADQDLDIVAEDCEEVVYEPEGDKGRWWWRIRHRH